MTLATDHPRSAPQGHAPDGGADLADFVEQAGVRIRAELAGIHARVADQVQGLQVLSERETLAIGSVLGTIVERVQVIVREGEEARQRSEEGVERITSEFLGRMSGEAEKQEAAVSRMFELAESIGSSIEAIDTLRHSTEMLAINSKIEAARLGDQGLPFAVLAEQIRDLGGSVRATTERVALAIENVRTGLPAIAESTEGMTTHLQAYVAEMQAHIHGQRGDDACPQQDGLGELAELSNRALSHLQFQDPLVQQLGDIERELGALAGPVLAALAGEVPPAPDEALDPETEPSSGGTPDSGEILLF